MSEQLLQQILGEFKEMRTEMQEFKTEMQGFKTEQQSMKAQLDENTQLTRAIFDRQEETDAKLENLTMDVHKLHGEVAEIKDILDFTYQKTTRNELEIYKLKKNSDMHVHE
ncbi:hypothetical protein [Sporosarcina beigongshangi]|uniref:hypothetical protein n=1 Tax=Sporosarcina beigongshangi TaxID=2782538 RepID=UPI0019398740|nr:hypothetical protein [Sporosarcina beigongshangi]